MLLVTCPSTPIRAMSSRGLAGAILAADMRSLNLLQRVSVCPGVPARTGREATDRRFPCASGSPPHRSTRRCFGRTAAAPRRGRIHARPPEQRLMPRSCCPPSPCGRLSRPRTTTRTPTHPEPISRHRAFPGHHQQPGEHEVSPTFTMIRLTGSEAGSTPTAKPAGTRSIPPVTTPRETRQTWSEPP